MNDSTLGKPDLAARQARCARCTQDTERSAGSYIICNRANELLNGLPARYSTQHSPTMYSCFQPTGKFPDVLSFGGTDVENKYWGKGRNQFDKEIELQQKRYAALTRSYSEDRLKGQLLNALIEMKTKRLSLSASEDAVDGKRVHGAGARPRITAAQIACPSTPLSQVTPTEFSGSLTTTTHAASAETQRVHEEPTQRGKRAVAKGSQPPLAPSRKPRVVHSSATQRGRRPSSGRPNDLFLTSIDPYNSERAESGKSGRGCRQRAMTADRRPSEAELSECDSDGREGQRQSQLQGQRRPTQPPDSRRASGTALGGRVSAEILSHVTAPLRARDKDVLRKTTSTLHLHQKTAAATRPVSAEGSRAASQPQAGGVAPTAPPKATDDGGIVTPSLVVRSATPFRVFE